jgi:hypothetical protein
VIDIRVTDDGAAVDLTGGEVYLQARTAPNRAAQLVLSASVATGEVALTDPTNGEAVITFEAEDTDQVRSDLWYEVVLDVAGYEADTLQSGRLLCNPVVVVIP